MTSSTMSAAVEEPSQAEKLEGVAEAAAAGPGATDKETNVGDPLSEKPNESSTAASSSEDHVVDSPPTAEGKAHGQPSAPERSKGKVALIMGSLMVSAYAYLHLHPEPYLTQSADPHNLSQIAVFLAALDTVRNYLHPNWAKVNIRLHVKNRQLLQPPFLQSQHASTPRRQITHGSDQHIS